MKENKWQIKWGKVVKVIQKWGKGYLYNGSASPALASSTSTRQGSTMMKVIHLVTTIWFKDYSKSESNETAKTRKVTKKINLIRSLKLKFNRMWQFPSSIICSAYILVKEGDPKKAHPCSIRDNTHIAKIA